jgi:hypothetical protein
LKKIWSTTLPNRTKQALFGINKSILSFSDTTGVGAAVGGTLGGSLLGALVGATVGGIGIAAGARTVGRSFGMETYVEDRIVFSDLDRSLRQHG